MTKAERLERSRQRAQEYHRRRRIRLTILAVAVVLYVVVPLLWYGGVEFGLVHAIQTPEFKDALSTARGAVLCIVLVLMSDFLRLQRQWEKQKDPEQEADVQNPTLAS